MKTDLMIVDFEATCDNTDWWKRDEMEIIEIGAVIVDEDFNVLSTYHKMVKPVIHTKLTEFCLNLTGISQYEVDEADTFDKVIVDFSDWIVENGVTKWGSWGGFDKRILEREISYTDHTAPKALKYHINLKEMYSKQKRLRRPMGLGKALREANLKFIGNPHRALDDALNISYLLKDFNND